MTISDRFKHSLKGLALLAALLLVGFLWLRHRIQSATAVTRQATLPSNDKEVVSYDENRHRITVTTASGTTSQYSRDPRVEVLTDGTVRVNANAWGSELRPFMGPGYSDTGRLYLGCDLFYYHQLDLGASFGWTANGNRAAFQPMLSVGWNFWSSTSLNVGANPAALVLRQGPEIAVFLSVRL